LDILIAIILGIIQGLTEFLPVSSSGHIELGKAMLDADFLNEDDLLFTIVVHFATVLSTMVVLRSDIVNLVKGLFEFKWNASWKYAALILLSMVPVGLVYVFFEERVEQLFSGDLVLVGAMLIVTGIILMLTKLVEKRAITGKEVGISNALIMGIAQSIAVIPGISRSGSTIATGLLSGVGKEQAARFSFLMVLPPIIGATLLEVKDFAENPTTSMDWAPLIAGFLAAFLSGVFACSAMLRIVKRGKLSWFAWYCFAIGTIAIVWTLTKGQ